MEISSKTTNLLKMSKNKLPEQQAIIAHLTNFSQDQSIGYFSGYVAALRDARKFTKRNQDNGQKLDTDSCGDHGSWLGAIGYITLLDQIGKCFKPKTVITISDGNTICKALKYFASHIPEAEVNVIYALRNACAHDYSLYNINTRTPTYTHPFTVVQGA